MKTARLSLMFLACAATIPAFAQNTTDSRCGSTNYDSSRQIFTITNPTAGMTNQQCFVTVVPKTAWTGGMPDLSTSQLVEGNYEITLTGGGGGGGGGAGGERDHGRTEAGAGGDGGQSAIPFTTSRYLNPGVYRLTIGTGGHGGTAGTGGEHMATSGGRGVDGGPTSLSDAYSGQTVAGFPGAESWNGTYPLVALGYAGAPAATGQHGAKGGGGAGGTGVGNEGFAGGNGYIKMALKDPVPQVQRKAAPVVAEPEPTPVARPARQDRN